MLYQKYRPKTLEKFVGNQATVACLRAVLESDDPPQAMLFTGPSGCGKTTLARIVAQTLGCVGTDYREIDSAHFRGIDTIREIRSQTKYKAQQGKSRVWLLDECHKLSNDAQNALLKALEDPPKHVYFLLATTEPQKLLKTVRNRCSDFPVVALTENKITRLLQRVCRAEGKKIGPEVQAQIARDSLGSARAALVVLEKIIDLDPDKMLQAAKRKAIEENQVIELCRLLLKGGSWKKVSAILKGLDAEPESIRRAVLGYCATVLLGEDNPRAYLIIDSFRNNLFDSGRAGLVAICYEVDQEDT